MISSYVLTIRRCISIKAPICFSLPILYVIGSSFGSKCVALVIFEKVSCFAKLFRIVYFLIKIYYHNIYYSYIPITPPPLTLPASACSAFAYFIAMSNDLIIPLTSLSIADNFLAVSMSSSSSAYISIVFIIPSAALLEDLSRRVAGVSWNSWNLFANSFTVSSGLYFSSLSTSLATLHVRSFSG
nr:MAG TPA: hypothetical protein [Crassvirales sp.]